MPPPPTDATLPGLRQLLSRLRTWPPVGATPTPTDTEALVVLQQAAAALQHQHDSANQPGEEDVVLVCCESVVHMLLRPPEQLFSGLGGAPCEPAAGMELAGEHFHAMAAAQLQLLCQLLRLGSKQLQWSTVERPHERPPPSGASRSQAFPGIVEVAASGGEQEGGSINQQQQQLQARCALILTHVLQAAALYAADGSSVAAGTASSTGGDDDSLDSVVAAVTREGLELHSPWSSAACQLHGQQLMQHTEQQEGGVLPWCRAVPAVLDSLRDTLMAQHRHKQLQDKGAEMAPYCGPSTFQRCLAARQLAWLVQQQQQQDSLSEDLTGLLLPLLLATADDPSPSVQRYGHSGLAWLGLHCAPSCLHWQAPLLRAELQRLVVGCDASCWATAMPAATSLALALEGGDARSLTYHALLAELLTAAERGTNTPQQRLVLIACFARLCEQLGLYAVRHFSTLLPLVLEWCHAHDEGSSVASLQLLALLAAQTRPRMAVHAAVLAQHAEAVLRQAAVEGGGSHRARAARDLRDTLGV